MAQSSISPAMLQRYIAEQQQRKQLEAMMGGMDAPSGIDGASQQPPGVPIPTAASLMNQPTGPMGRGRPSLMDMMQAPPGLLDMAPNPYAHRDTTDDAGSLLKALMEGSQPQAPIPAGLPSFRQPPTPAMMSPELAAQRKAKPAEYTIKKGDTLSAIAKRNGTTVKALLAKNPQIKNANKIFAGKKIKL